MYVSRADWLFISDTDVCAVVVLCLTMCFRKCSLGCRSWCVCCARRALTHGIASEAKTVDNLRELYTWESTLIFCKV